MSDLACLKERRELGTDTSVRGESAPCHRLGSALTDYGSKWQFHFHAALEPAQSTSTRMQGAHRPDTLSEGQVHEGEHYATGLEPPEAVPFDPSKSAGAQVSL